MNLGNFVEMDFPYSGHLLGILVLILATIGLGKINPKYLFLSRKILHIGAISAVAHAVFITQKSGLNMLFFNLLIAAFTLTLFVFFGFFQIDGRKSWGIAYFPWALCLLLKIVPDEKNLIAISFAVLAMGDGFSAIAGRYIKSKNPNNQTINGKTWVGFVVFTVCTWMVLWGSHRMGLIFSFDGLTLPYFLLVLGLIALSTALVETLSSGGTDNFWIPLWVVLMFSWQRNWETLVHQWAFLLLPIAGLIYWVFKRKWLALDGLFMALLLALLIILSGLSLIPVLIFFFLGSLASKWNKSINSDHKHGRPRDRWQVLANGGWVGLLAILNQLLLHVDLIGNMDAGIFVWVLMSAALGDTLSSEMGMRFGKTAYSMKTLKPVPVGLSGGVSMTGLLGAFLGGVVMFVFGVIDGVVSQNLSTEVVLNDFQWWRYWGFVLFSGLGGSLVDSILGEFLQERFDQNGILSDSGRDEEFVSGIRGFSNDWVNFISLGIWFLIGIFWFYGF